MMQVNKNYSKFFLTVLLSGIVGVQLINPMQVKADSYSNDDQKTISIDKAIYFPPTSSSPLDNI